MKKSTEKSIQERTQKNTEAIPLLSVLGAIFFFAVMFFAISTRWEWCIFMDEVAFNTWMPKIQDFFPAFLKEIESYWKIGRFFPTKYFFNLLRWMYLPSSAYQFHLLQYALLVVSFGFAALGLRRHFPRIKPVYFFSAVVGLGLLQKPVLDQLTYASIPETYVILFLGLGIWAFDRPILSRILFLIAALGKEPAIFIFLGLGVASFLKDSMAAGRPTRIRKWAWFDFGLFLVLLYVMWTAKNAGTYLAGYQAASPRTFKIFFYSLGRLLFWNLGFFLLALLAGVRPWARGFWQALTTPLPCAFLLLGLPYLFIASGLGDAGYIQIPVAFAMYVFGIYWVLKAVEETRVTSLQGAAVFLCFIGMFGTVYYRWTRHVQGTNGSALALRTLLITQHPRLIYMNGYEPRFSGQRIIDEWKVPVVLRNLVEFDPNSPEETKLAEGREIFILEYTKYYGIIPPETLEALSKRVGPIKQFLDAGVYRIFYATQHDT